MNVKTLCLNFVFWVAVTLFTTNSVYAQQQAAQLVPARLIAAPQVATATAAAVVEEGEAEAAEDEVKPAADSETPAVMEAEKKKQEAEATAKAAEAKRKAAETKRKADAAKRKKARLTQLRKLNFDRRPSSILKAWSTLPGTEGETEKKEMKKPYR